MERYRGQSLVELALITPVLLILILVTVDGARVFSAHIAISNAAREGANYASRNMEAAENTALIEEAVFEESGAIFGQFPVVDSEVLVDDFGYDAVRVDVTYTFETLFNFPGLPNQIELQRTAQMRILVV
jgi:Flp pilus assembly protein TadG